MKYNNVLVVAMLSIGFLSGTIFCAETRSKHYLESFLEESGYAPHVIKYLRAQYAENIADIDEILENHYTIEYYRAIENKKTRIEKLMLLGRIQAHLLLSPGAIERNQEGPALMGSDDGSDRGVEGLRMRTLKKVISEIQAIQE